LIIFYAQVDKAQKTTNCIIMWQTYGPDYEALNQALCHNYKREG